jgi:hypothetical protein
MVNRDWLEGLDMTIDPGWIEFMLVRDAMPQRRRGQLRLTVKMSVAEVRRRILKHPDARGYEIESIACFAPVT